MMPMCKKKPPIKASVGKFDPFMSFDLVTCVDSSFYFLIAVEQDRIFYRHRLEVVVGSHNEPEWLCSFSTPIPT
jgi:hypothetical protein